MEQSFQWCGSISTLKKKKVQAQAVSNVTAISFGNVNQYMYAHRNRPLSTEVDFLPDSPPSYHSATRPVTYPPQRVRLLSDVNVYNDYFSADQHYER